MFRRVHSAFDGFGGVGLATIDLSYFGGHYSIHNLGPPSSITLSSTSGILLARHPSREKLIGTDISRAMLFRNRRERATDSYLTVTVIDGVQRFIGYRRSDRYLLVVATAMSEDQALQAWRAQMRLDMAVALILIGLLGTRLASQMRHSQAADEEVRQSEAQYRSQDDSLLEANEHAALGLGCRPGRHDLDPMDVPAAQHVAAR